MKPGIITAMGAAQASPPVRGRGLKLKRVRLEVEMLLPAGADLNSALLLARITEALEGLAKQAKIERLKYDPG